MQHKFLSTATPLLVLVATVFFWSSSFVAIRMGLKGYDAGSLALFRYCIASICMIVVFFCLRKKQLPSLKDIPFIFVIGAIGFGVYNITLNFGEVTVNSGISSFIVSQMPVVIAFLAILFLHERLNLYGWTGMAISIIGVIIIAIGESEGTHLQLDIGVIYLLIAAFSGAAYAVMHKPFLIKYNPIEFTAYAIWSGTIFMLFYLPSLLQEIPRASTLATLSVIYLGIFPAVIGYIGWSYLLKHMPASKVGSILYIMPVITTLLGWLLLAEIPTFLSLIGGFIALAGAIIINQKKKKKI